MTISNGDLELLVKAENYIEDEKIKSQLHNLTEKLMIIQYMQESILRFLFSAGILLALMVRT